MSANLQVLVIDDDAVVGRSFDRVLSEKGYDVSTVLSGEEAMDRLKIRILMLFLPISKCPVWMASKSPNVSRHAARGRPWLL